VSTLSAAKADIRQSKKHISEIKNTQDLSRDITINRIRKSVYYSTKISTTQIIGIRKFSRGIYFVKVGSLMQVITKE
jgi:hypothetical protein